MSEIGGVCGGRKHFSAEEEAALRSDVSSKEVLRSDTKTNVDVHGLDRTWRSEKSHEHDATASNIALLVAHGGHAGAEGAEVSGLVEAAEHSLVHRALEAGRGAAADKAARLGGAAFTIGATAAGLWLGVHELAEAEAHGEAQKASLVRDQVHVALLSALDLPAGYKQAQYDGPYKGVERGHQSPAAVMGGRLRDDTTGLALLQLHCDRGMHAAKDVLAAGMTMAAFLEKNPKVAEAYRQDAAFKEGFDAYLHTAATDRAAAARLNEKLEMRDGWYAQSAVAVRV